DRRTRHIPQVVRIEQQQRAEIRFGQGRLRPAEPVAPQPVEVDPLLPIHRHRRATRRDARAYRSSHPPSTSRLTPLTAAFSSRNVDASTISSMVTRRPSGVRARTASSTASGFPAQAGLSPTMPGWIAFTRIGASSTASVWTTPVTPPLTVVTVVEPGYG